nr:probable glycosyltransferase At5g03795 [Ipomoea batatas]
MMKFDGYVPMFKSEKRRLLWVVGVLFGLAIVVQYFELPYGTVTTVSFSLHGLGWWNSIGMNATNHVGGSASLGSETEIKNGFVLGNEGGGDSGRGDGFNFSVQTGAKAPERARRFEGGNGVVAPPPANLSVELMPTISPSPPLSPSGGQWHPNATSIASSAVSPSPEEAKMVKDVTTAVVKPRSLPSDLSLSCENPLVKKTALVNKAMAAVPISEMKNMLPPNHSSYLLIKPLWPSVVDQELLNAKSQIENAATVQDDGADLHASVYWNVSRFKRSYELMEKTLKVYIYTEGERPIFHQSADLTGIYASEGWFMRQLINNTGFVTNDPGEAHLFYLPFSSHNLEKHLYVRDSHSFTNIIEYMKSYVELIKGRHPFWNRTCGADHFLVACHDWAAEETRYDMANCIRSLCVSDLREGVQLGKDVSLPETYVHSSSNPLQSLGGYPPSKRRFLAFFAGQMHGYVRPTLLQYWENKDPDMKIFGHMDRKDYIVHMKSSKYCICARGYEVNSPRVVEAISYECVPVIISDNFVPPFFETLNWESFAVFVLEKDIPNLKNILMSIPEKTYREMKTRVNRVQRHFLWHSSPQRYDIFHMILHSIWYTRVFRTVQ